MKPKILVDCDDTIIDLCTVWVEQINRLYGTNVKIEDIDGWDLLKRFPTLTKQQILSPLLDHDFWNIVPVKKDAMEIIPKLINEGYDIYICTATDYRNFTVKMENIIMKYFPCISPHKVISCFDKTMIQGDILIDDNIENLSGGVYKKILFTSQHNKAYDAVWPYSSIHRANDWYECYDLIHKLVPIEKEKQYNLSTDELMEIFLENYAR